jgi:hypothetical protein
LKRSESIPECQKKEHFIELGCFQRNKSSSMNRKAFLKSGLVSMSGLMSLPAAGARVVQEKEKQIDAERIKAFVVAGHGDLETVQRMLLEEPNLIFARHDWGGGDFEEAIEGAGHVGNRAIAEYLITQGARVNLFILTMLGKRDIVIPALEEYPSLIRAKGAHGLSLLHHAKMGGDVSKEILGYLMEKGLSISKFDM